MSNKTDDVINVLGACTKHPSNEVRRVFGKHLDAWLLAGQEPYLIVNAIVAICYRLDEANQPLDMALTFMTRRTTQDQQEHPTSP